MDSKSCTICCETYNKSNHSSVCCPNKECNYTACKECIRTYLLGKTNAPHCMSCKQAWSYYFMAMNLNKVYLENQYTKHRAKILMESEKSKMPDTMNAVDNYVAGENLEKEAKIMDQDIADLHKQLRDLNAERNNKLQEANALKTGKKVVTERKKFIMPCPCDDCRGFLSTSYKCGACSNHACPRCLEVLGPNPNHVQHTCNEDEVKTAELIKNTTKPCPKCGERISKIEGCDQMWCVTCHTAFSWRTGNIENGVVHNPHYYQYQRQVNNGEAVRNPGDVLCGGLPNWFSNRRNMRAKWHQSPQPVDASPEDLSNFMAVTELFETIHRVIAHVTHAELVGIRNRVRDANDHRNLRIQYILNRIDEKKMSEIINAEDKKLMKDNELLHIYELISVVGIELFVSIQDKINESSGENMITTNEMTQFMKEKACEFMKFTDYCNEQFRKISISYNCSIPIIVVNCRLYGNQQNGISRKIYECKINRIKSTLKQMKEIETNKDYSSHGTQVEWLRTQQGTSHLDCKHFYAQK
jgi:hypothetical protein